jgi:hypothetical protein
LSKENILRRDSGYEEQEELQKLQRGSLRKTAIILPTSATLIGPLKGRRTKLFRPVSKRRSDSELSLTKE